MTTGLAVNLFLGTILTVECYHFRPFFGGVKHQQLFPVGRPYASSPLTMTTSFAPVPPGHAGVKDRSAHVDILDQSLKDHTGRGVYERMGTSEPCCCEVCLNQRYALVSHGPEDEPCYNYGNSAFLSLLDCTWDELCHLPTRRLSDSGDDLVGRDLMEKGVGYAESETSIWVTHDGEPFTVHDMLIWNCYDETGKYYGQAALFDRNKMEGKSPKP